MSAQVPESEKGVNYEPLLPVEKKLIGWSVSLGLALLLILLWITRVLLPAG
ncbi:MAG TPA: hypothetical protein VF193_15150 [Steroidobacter sp.]